MASVTVTATMLWGGGASAHAQFLLICGAAVTLLMTGMTVGWKALWVTRRSLVVVFLGFLATLSALSAVWTVAGGGDALRTGLVIAAYCALATCGLASSRGGAAGGRWIFGLIVASAALEDAVGLVGACLHRISYASWIGGAWRPAGTFGYPSALALLSVMALPGILHFRDRGNRAGLLMSLLAFLAGAAIGAAGERLEIALTAVWLVTSITVPWLRDTRMAAATVALFVVFGELAGRLIVARHTAATAVAEPGALAVFAITCGIAAMAAVYLHRRGRHRATGAGRRLLAGVTLCLVLVVAAVGVATGTRSGAATNHRGGVTHGRTGEWRAAAETWLHRPILGSGAGSYLQASVEFQGSTLVRYPHEFMLEMAAELGILGLAIALGLYGSVAGALWQVPRRATAWLLAPAVAVFLVSNLVDWTWHLTALTAIWALCLGPVLAAASGEARPVPV